MKIIVISNCATGAYVKTIQALFPSFDVRGARLDIAQKWIKEANGPFLQFCASADLAVGLAARPDIAPVFSPRVFHLEIPSFIFRGLHPDVLQLSGNSPNPLMAGHLWSRIIVAGFFTGNSADETIACFNKEIYEALGYFTAFPLEKDTLLQTFDEKGICLIDAFERWLVADKFLYTPNHPSIAVFIDIMVTAWRSHIGNVDQAFVDVIGRGTLHDELADSIFWPVYPEIALRFGGKGEFAWLTGIDQRRKQYDLTTFVQQCYSVLNENCAFGPSVIQNYEKVSKTLRIDACKHSHVADFKSNESFTRDS